MSTREVHVVGVPMDLGAGRRGVDMGPSALRLAQLERTLTSLGFAVADLGNVEVAVPESAARLGGGAGEPLYADAIAAACAAAAEALRDRPDGAFAIALGGDHSVSMGTVPGVAAGGELGVLWVDAHADVNTPETSPSGNVHGMPVAHLLGLGDARFTALWGDRPPLSPRDVVYVGLRSVDPPEREAIVRLGIAAYTMSDVDRRGIAAVATEALGRLSHAPRLHVSFDADVLDPTIAPGVGTPVPGGLTYREAHLLMEVLAESGRVVSLDLVEVNPILDVANRTAATLVELTASLLGKRIL
ncbi:MAG TPA: arginase [Trueperaceae bacterium]|jgi:arginase